jgi:alpha-L-arabinofuranosidase
MPRSGGVARYRSRARRGRARPLTTCAVLLAAVAGTAAFRAAPSAALETAGSQQPATSIVVGAGPAQGTVSQAVLGHDYLWPFGGMGSYDGQAGFYPDFLHQLEDGVGPGSLRYPGGITAEVFHWMRAVGPQSQRTPNAFGPAQGPSSGTVGPDEFGQLLDATGAQGVVTANFATGTAQEAADFVSYMTGKPGTSKWADMRVSNGHRAPYNVPYWEVGNEEDLSLYWRSGTPVTVGGPPGACQNVATCLYIYGGSTSFSGQPAVQYANRTPAAAQSAGAPGETFYAQYPPVAPGTATVSVAGSAWTQVASLAGAGPGDQVYTLDPASGEITFGDGTHGAIPPQGAQVTVSYVSGPHDGFLQFYRAMKAANPGIRICSADTSDDFIESMGSTLPYDCLQYHPYVSTGTVANDVPIGSYQEQIMAAPADEAQAAAQLEATIGQYAKRQVPLALTEYGQLLSSNPDGYPYYHDSLDAALLNASQLAEWIGMGIPVADRQLLTAEIPPASQCCAGLPGAAPFATTGAIGTPGPGSVLEATGQVYGLFAPLAGGSVLPVQTPGNPVLTTVGGQTVPTLSVLAVRTAQHEYLLGINRSPSGAVTAAVNPVAYRHSGLVTAQTLNAASSLSYNSPEQPDAVTLASSSAATDAGAFSYTFPAHSVTLLRLTGHEVMSRPSLALRAGPIAVPGSPATATATLSNQSHGILAGDLSVSGPDGWAVSPGGPWRYVLRPGQSVTRSYRVLPPGQAPPGSYQLTAAASADGLTLDEGTASLLVPATMQQSFGNAGISDDSDVDSANFDGVGNSYSGQALAAAGLAPGGSVTDGGVSFTWPDVPAGQPDNVLAQGQTVQVSGSGTTLGFLGASSSEPTATGSGTVYYTDGSTSSYNLTLYGFFNAPPGSADQVAATLPYENSQGIGGRPRGQYDHTVYVFYASAPLTAGKTVQAVTLPSGGSAGSGRVAGMHFFAIGVG